MKLPLSGLTRFDAPANQQNILAIRSLRWINGRWLGLCVALLMSTLGALASSVVPPQFDELVNESDYIVRSVVKSVRSEWLEKGGHRSIFTHVELQVLEVIHGTPPQPLVLEMLGGQVGDEQMVVAGMPQFTVGQEDILFIRGNGRQFYPLTAAMHGRYPVLREKTGIAHVMRSNHEPLRRTAEVAMAMAEGSVSPAQQATQSAIPALTPESFTQQIQAAVNPNYHRADRKK